MGAKAYDVEYRDTEYGFIIAKNLLDDNQWKAPEDLPWANNKKTVIKTWASSSPQKGLESYYQGHNIMIVISKAREEWDGIMTENDVLKKQVKSLNHIIDEKDNLLNSIISKYIDVRIACCENIIDILFEMYGQGFVSISQVKELAKINQYQFVKILSEKDMGFYYPEEDSDEKKSKMNKLMNLPLRSR